MRRKFLKTIYDIQQRFGVDFAGVGRTFSFGILPTKQEEEKLERWFTEVNGAKNELYQEIFSDFKENISNYLPEKPFDYGTFFEKKSVQEISRGRKLVGSSPIVQGFRQEIGGAINSFIAHHKLKFDGAIQEIKEVKKRIEENTAVLEDQKSEFDHYTTTLLDAFNGFLAKDYEEVTQTYQSVSEAADILERVNALIGDYNYALNQLITADLFSPPKTGGLLERIGRLPRFPVVEREHTELVKVKERQRALQKLLKFADGRPDVEFVTDYVGKLVSKATRRSQFQRLSFEKRLAYWVDQSTAKEDKNTPALFMQAVDVQLKKLAAHHERKRYDGASRRKYFDILALRARMVHPDKAKEINTLRSQLVGRFLVGRVVKELITAPGFSWTGKGDSFKPQYNVAFARRDNDLYFCLTNSRSSFVISDDGDLEFMKLTGGSRIPALYKRKEVEYIRGAFNSDEGDASLLLPLHFGQSYAHRYLTNSRWGFLSRNPLVFPDNARIKRVRINLGDPWRYFIDVTFSGEPVFGLKKFMQDILGRTEAVIGIDRGEVKSIAYCVLSSRDNSVLDSGFLAEEYVPKLKEYRNRIEKQQSAGKMLSKHLWSKISRLQKTSLEAAISEILRLCAKYKAAVAIEDLGRKFKGGERQIIPKKVYVKIEDLLGNALQFAGLVHTAPQGTGPLQLTKSGKIPPGVKYWGNFIAVYPAGTSQTCLRCGMCWNSELRDRIFDYSKKLSFDNIDSKSATLSYDGKKLTMNKEWTEYSKTERCNKEKHLMDLHEALQDKDSEKVKKQLNGALRHRPQQDKFICHACGFTENADIVGATNIARRGREMLINLLT